MRTKLLLSMVCILLTNMISAQDISKIHKSVSDAVEAGRREHRAKKAQEAANQQQRERAKQQTVQTLSTQGRIVRDYHVEDYSNDMIQDMLEREHSTMQGSATVNAGKQLSGYAEKYYPNGGTYREDKADKYTSSNNNSQQQVNGNGIPTITLDQYHDWETSEKYHGWKTSEKYHAWKRNLSPIREFKAPNSNQYSGIANRWKKPKRQMANTEIKAKCNNASCQPYTRQNLTGMRQTINTQYVRYTPVNGTNQEKRNRGTNPANGQAKGNSGKTPTTSKPTGNDIISQQSNPSTPPKGTKKPAQQTNEEINMNNPQYNSGNTPSTMQPKKEGQEIILYYNPKNSAENEVKAGFKHLFGNRPQQPVNPTDIGDLAIQIRKDAMNGFQVPDKGPRSIRARDKNGNIVDQWSENKDVNIRVIPNKK